MSDPSETPWSDNPNAPQIPYSLHFNEKVNFVGYPIGAMFYGIIVLLFFQCMSALFNPTNRTKKGTKWGLAIHTVAMFSFVTISIVASLQIQSISYVDNREFPGFGDGFYRGPFGYQSLIVFTAFSDIPGAMFFLNDCLAHGLLLYRCCVIYAMNYWAIAFPSLIYLFSVGAGIAVFYYRTMPLTDKDALSIFDLDISYFSISIALNVLLTLMIGIRLILHSRKLRKSLGTPTRASGLYKAIVTMLVESSALYAVSSLLYVGLWGANSTVSDIFLQIFIEAQVISPYLITLRVASRSAMTNEVIVSGNVGPIRFRGKGGPTGGNRSLPGGSLAGSIDVDGETFGELGVGSENTTLLSGHHDD